MTKSEFFDEDPSAPKASFQGQLSIQDFMFKASQSGSSSTQPSSRTTRTSTAGTMLTRRSPRLATPVKALSTPASPSPSPSPSLKRKSSTSTSASASPSKTPNKKKKKSRSQGYAPPSTYAHLPPLADVLAPNLLVLFVGLNPGVQTARTGHAYAHPSNLFWKLLHSSGITPTPAPCRADEDRTLPARFACGSTNIVARPSRSGAELARSELDAGVSVLEAKIRRWRPEVACIVGKSIWESVWRVRRGGGRRAPTKAEFRYGWQDERENMGRVQTTRGVLGGGDGGDDDDDEAADVAEGVVVDPNWKGARVFVASSTSGLAASLSPAEKERIWRELGEWVEKRREEKGIKKEDLV
ncbi:uncharacterized protein E0L32_011231 [Thyridium curvatum]|uniref:Uracil-DNA glycosylase-like domain-containing protein n=1 Tax=Thyridium curvatum TaxID=1093900 RepID=A0A507BQH5_9PEZI|nr:uncharacterized protein E0L32_011231 [Thyridium curvatum]TPX19070.1 hypothetical protein E0L32_011231 [Thyridium curvatum]